MGQLWIVSCKIESGTIGIDFICIFVDLFLRDTILEHDYVFYEADVEINYVIRVLE